ncbi:dehydrogenase/reductase SDR family member 7-like [Dioscorea cayenensis subsp. rotundata]|uniref:Dehydrogenase/reductase SDR family member 7-like n=1 Tax=Dioscorea cayennensis subsp. rotundata TaxID=55577 RepID=A0AB40BEH8_DIOCR|nr:dehydrogenase/reductase SDR family member 7-like [Dioscorea cayenensis subsp. rotundata]
MWGLFALGFVIFVFLAVLVRIVRFALADADLTLLSKGGPKRSEVEGKVAWITGGSKGIGKELARQFVGLGAKVIISARNLTDLGNVKAEILGRYPNAEVEILPLDVMSDEEILREAVKKAESFFSSAGVYYMVHNAGDDPPPKRAAEITWEEALTTIKTNVLGTINLTRLIVPFMIKRGRGHFVVIGSTAGKCPAPSQSVYSASKFALNGYFHTLRSELIQKGINVTVVCPGPIASKAVAYGNNDAEEPMPTDRCVHLTIAAATHNLKEVWISNQPVLLVMYLTQYMPMLGYWFMDKIGSNRVEASQGDSNTSLMTMLFGKTEEKTGKSAPLLQ